MPRWCAEPRCRAAPGRAPAAPRRGSAPGSTGPARGRRGAGNGVLETGRPLASGHAKRGPEVQSIPRARRRASGAGRMERPGARSPATPSKISAMGKLRQGAGRTAAGGVLTWRGAEPARGPGRAAAPSRTSRRGKSRSRAGGGAAEAAAGPPLCPLRRAPAPPPPARLRARRRRGGRGKLGISSARGGGAPCRVLAPRSGARARPRRAGQQLRGGGGAALSLPLPKNLPALRPRERAAAGGTVLALPLCGARSRRLPSIRTKEG